MKRNAVQKALQKAKKDSIAEDVIKGLEEAILWIRGEKLLRTQEVKVKKKE